MAAVFPSLAACQDNAVGPREIPDHPIVNQTLDDCLNEAMDLRALRELCAAIASGEVEVCCRDTTEPSLLAHEILNGRPYTFLDDAPLEERRTRAVQLRRGLPVEARDLSALDAEAIDRVHAEAKPEPRDAEELHDLLSGLYLAPPHAGLEGAFAELCALGRATTLSLDGRSYWCPSERLAELSALFPEALTVRGAAPGEAEPEQVAQAIVRAHLDVRGPSLPGELVLVTGLGLPLIEAAIGALEREGSVFVGRFDPRLGEAQVCSRRLLARIHSYTQKRLRREIEPVSSQDFMRFLLEFQHAAPASRFGGPEGVLHALAQLQGFEAAASAWESELLRARVRGYEPDWLDGHCSAGEVVWGRLTLRARSAPGGWASVSSTTPVTLALRDDFGWLLQSARGSAPEASVGPDAEQPSRPAIEVLRARGALFFAELAQYTGLSSGELHDALWDGVARGALTSDGFAALRTLLAKRSLQPQRLLPHGPRAGSLRRRGAPSARGREGRWVLLAAPTATDDREELAEALAEQLLARYGVVFRDLVVRESFTVPWREVQWAMRRLEARGQIRGGRFVAGFVGEQYALPEAVELLRRIRRTPHSGEVVHVSACDPLNLVGIVVPGPRVPALRGHQISYRDGLPLHDAAAAEAPVALA
jgi:ATP-dependent Lhr-like helicase